MPPPPAILTRSLRRSASLVVTASVLATAIGILIGLFDSSVAASASLLVICIGITGPVIAVAADLVRRWIAGAEQVIFPEAGEPVAWWEEQWRSIWNRKAALGAAFAGALVAGITHYGAVASSPLEARIPYTAISIIGGASGAVAGILLFRFAMMLHGLGKSVMRMPDAIHAIRELGATMLQVWGLAALLLSGYAMTAVVRWLSMGGDPVRLAFESTILACAAPVSTLIVLGFLASQLGIHRALVRARRRRLMELDKQIEEHRDRFLECANDTAKDQIDVLCAAREEARTWPEWTFSIQQLAAITVFAVASFAPSAIALADLLMHDS
jgi:hypothetical protein